jgi:4-aminobutyrate aminotransferase-like enzyme
VEHAARVGEELIGALRDLGIGEVRGCGLLVGVELESPGLAEEVVNRMRETGVLINRTGPRGDVLKLRPPLVFATEHVDSLVGTLGATLPGITEV